MIWHGFPGYAAACRGSVSPRYSTGRSVSAVFCSGPIEPQSTSNLADRAVQTCLCVVFKARQPKFNRAVWKALQEESLRGLPKAEDFGEPGISSMTIYLATSRSLRCSRAELRGRHDQGF